MLRKQTEKATFINGLLGQGEKTNYRKELSERKPEMKSARKAEEKDRSWAVEKGNEYTEYNNPIARSGNSIRSARCASEGGITDMGGPSKQVNVSGKNSIWDSEVLSRLANTASSKEATQMEKESSDRIRQKKQAEYKQNMTPRVGEESSEGLIKSASTVSPASATSSGKGWVPANKLSMFDTNENFDRLTALTERVNPTVKKEEKKAETKQASKALSSKDITSRFVNGITDQGKDTSYRSMHNDSVERLYKVLAERNKGN